MNDEITWRKQLPELISYLEEMESLGDEPVLYDSRDLVTHAVIVGMTGSGKTGLGISLLEEAAIDGVPVIAIDPKGDLGNLLLTFPGLSPAEFRPWVNEDDARLAGLDADAFAAKQAAAWSAGLQSWGQDAARIELPLKVLGLLEALAVLGLQPVRVFLRVRGIGEALDRPQFPQFRNDRLLIVGDLGGRKVPVWEDAAEGRVVGLMEIVAQRKIGDRHEQVAVGTKPKDVGAVEADIHHVEPHGHCAQSGDLQHDVGETLLSRDRPVLI